MSVEVRESYLLDNNFDFMSVRQNMDDYYVEVNKSFFLNNLLYNDLSFDLDNIDGDSVKINLLVDKFLEYTSINYLKYDLDRGACECKSSERVMDLSLSSFIFRDIYFKILNKYNLDREKFISNNGDVCRFKFDTLGYSSYEKKSDTIEIDLLNREDGLDSFDKKFFRDFLMDKFYQCDEDASIIEDIFYSKYLSKFIKNGYIISCGDISIEINNDLYDEALDVVGSYNKDRENQKVMQYKMEGF